MQADLVCPPSSAKETGPQRLLASGASELCTLGRYLNICHLQMENSTVEVFKDKKFHSSVIKC